MHLCYFTARDYPFKRFIQVSYRVEITNNYHMNMCFFIVLKGFRKQSAYSIFSIRLNRFNRVSCLRFDFNEEFQTTPRYLFQVAEHEYCLLSQVDVGSNGWPDNVEVLQKVVQWF